MDKIIEKTMKNLEKNNMTAVYAESRSEVPEIIKKLVPAGSSVSNGGSVSLRGPKRAAAPSAVLRVFILVERVETLAA